MSPQVGWIAEDGREVTFEQGIAEAEGYGVFGGYPPEVLVGMRDNLTKERPEAISVTQLLGCARKVFLDSKIKYSTKPEANYPAFRGQIIHAILEKAGGSANVEERIEREYRGVTISGSPDNIRTITAPGGGAERTLIRDWKSVKEVPKFDNAYSHHQMQVNLYRWLKGFDARLTDIELVYVSMSDLKILPLKRGGTNRYGKAIPNQIMTDEEVEAFLDDRLMLLNAQRQHDTPIRYDRVSEEDLWQCAYCEVKAECYKRAADEQREAWSAGEQITRIPPREKPKKGKK